MLNTIAQLCTCICLHWDHNRCAVNTAP